MRFLVFAALLCRVAAADVTAPGNAPKTCLSALEETRRALVGIEPAFAKVEARKDLGTGHIALKPVGLWVMWDDYTLRFTDKNGWLALYVGLPRDNEYNAPLGWGLKIPASAQGVPTLCERTQRSKAAASLCADGISGDVLREIAARLKAAVAFCFTTVDKNPRPPRWERIPAEILDHSRDRH